MVPRVTEGSAVLVFISWLEFTRARQRHSSLTWSNMIDIDKSHPVSLNRCLSSMPHWHNAQCDVWFFGAPSNDNDTNTS